MDGKFDGLQEIIDKALASMEAESTGDFDPQECNLAEFCRRTGLTRQRARTIKANGFRVKPHGRLGMKASSTVLSGHTGFVDDQLRKGVTNSQVVYERLLEQGYEGGLTTVKVYMADHADLVPAKRRATGPQRGSGQRFRSGPAESYQMDWGFANVEDWAGRRYSVVLGKEQRGVTAFDGALSYSRPSTKGLSLSSIASLLMTVPKSRCSLFSFVIV